MTDTTLDAAERGALILRDRVFTRVAVATARSMPGVVTHRARFARRDLPRATTTFDSASRNTPEGAHVTLDLAMSWPARVSQLTHDLRARVSSDIARVAGAPPRRIDIRVTMFTGAGAEHAATLDGPEEHPPHPATVPRDPLSAPAARYFALAVGAVLIVLGAIGIRDYLIVREILPGDVWITPALDAVLAAVWHPWMYAVAGTTLVIGVFCLLAAVLPRRKTHRRLTTADPAWMRPTDIARRCSALAREVSGVTSARTEVTRKRATVTVMALNPGAPGLAQAVKDRVTSGLDLLESPLQVKVRLRPALKRGGTR
ncbi:DUF6286 domain-containing protein [Hoyosella sp. YIM 151337]|uniref:DUF6286 domain-containing Asp23/Gls24 family envelope stress response protein n=1 Tax=Hoyosella sp. YIM 151337 TaxID=2992742 RepID=UPI00223572ED|nr:DUF6286 domain-containing protein [Hoyosella sp. YIM 151337]MCW4351902.1 DUF6286 domain-containing protein [Hoyosella sp. YIM 151337]